MPNPIVQDPSAFGTVPGNIGLYPNAPGGSVPPFIPPPLMGQVRTVRRCGLEGLHGVSDLGVCIDTESGEGPSPLGWQ